MSPAGNLGDTRWPFAAEPRRRIAEGLEDAQLLAPLLEAGCDEGQGYLFGKPMPADRIEQMLAPKQDCTGLVATAA